jgi:hypothetical protein
VTTAKKTTWALEGDFFQACNCDYGCPCEFEAPPTMGFCDGMGAWRIAKGRYGRVRMDGLALGFAAHWPGPIHKGNGTVAILVDAKAKPEQRDALLQIASGKAGGMPFEIIVQTVTKVIDPLFVPFEFSGKGKNTSVKMGNKVTIALEPIKNPVTGQAESVRVVHATGFIFKSAEALSAKEGQSKVPGLEFSYPNKAGFVAKFKYGN